MKARIKIIFLILSLVPFVSAQEFDDVFFRPNRDRTPAEPAQTAAPANNNQTAARDVDEYNRRVVAEMNDEMATADDFLMTDDGRLYFSSRINRFHGGDIFINNADVFVDQNTGNVFIDGGNSFNNMMWNGGWNNPFHRNMMFFDPWMTPAWRWSAWGWGPGWNFGWSSSWGWNAGWAWGGPSWGWNAGWGWGGPSWGWGGGWWNRPVPPIWTTPPRRDFTTNRRPISNRPTTTTTAPSRRDNNVSTGTPSRRGNVSTGTTGNDSRLNTTPTGTRRGTTTAPASGGTSRGSGVSTAPSRGNNNTGTSRGSSFGSSGGGSSRSSGVNSGSSGGSRSSGGSSRGGSRR